MNNKRVYSIDIIRGIAILGMVIYHTMYDLVYLFHVYIGLMFNDFFRGFIVFGAGVFIFISGASCKFSSNNLKRGLRILLFGVLISAFSFVFMSSSPIYIGIFTLLGGTILLYCLIEKFLDKLPPALGIIIFTALAIAGFWLDSQSFTTDFPLGILISMPWNGFSSSDYFPFIPWSLVFFIGTYFGTLLKSNAFPKWFYNIRIPPLEWIGRHTLMIYILHQPVIYSVLWIIFYFIRN